MAESASIASRRACLLLAMLACLGSRCVSGETATTSTPPPSATSAPTKLLLERSGGAWPGPGFRFRITLTSEGDALWEGIQEQSRSGRHVGTIEAASFERLANQAVADAVEWERIAPSLEGRISFDGSYARLTIRRLDGSSAEIGPTIMGTDVAFDPLMREIEELAEEIDWTPLDGPPALQDPVPPEVASPRTVASLDSGKLLTLAGEFQQVEALWPDTALVYRHEYAIWCLDGGARTPRLIHEFPRQEWHRMSAPAWSLDGETFYVWLHASEQFVGIDARTGEQRSLLMLPTHPGIEFRPHPDPNAVWRRQGIVEDVANGRLLQLVQEESNDDVAFWQRSAERKGGHQLLSIPIAGGPAVPLTGEEQLPGEVDFWDLSLRRSELYRRGRDKEGRWLVVSDLEGHIQRSIEVPFEAVHGIVLSPDEQWLLIERRYRPGYVPPKKSSAERRREELHLAVAQSKGGFVLYDLDDRSFRDGPTGGSDCAWSPDSKQVAVLDYWTLSLFDVEAGTLTPIAVQEPDEPGDVSPGYWEGPVWSRDGQRLAVRLAHTPTLLLDFARREFMLFDEYVEDATWAPIPAPFGG